MRWCSDNFPQAVDTAEAPVTMPQEKLRALWASRVVAVIMCQVLLTTINCDISLKKREREVLQRAPLTRGAALRSSEMTFKKSKH